MDKLKYVHIESEIQLALKLCKGVKYVKIFFAVLITFVYFLYPAWLLDVITVTLVFSLLLPLGFFDTFIQKKLEYNTQKIEERQILNSAEANDKLNEINKKITQ